MATATVVSIESILKVLFDRERTAKRLTPVTKLYWISSFDLRSRDISALVYETFVILLDALVVVISWAAGLNLSHQLIAHTPSQQ
jgi:hypothetical protein